MELIKSNIHMSRIKDSKTTQITLDDDFVIQDVKPDVETILANRTDIAMESIKVLEGKVLLKGRLTYRVLYCAPEPGTLYAMDGSIPFDEVINMDEINENDAISMDYSLEDVSISIINSRKINVRAIVSFTGSCEEIYDEDAIVDVNAEDSTDFIKKPLEVTKLVVSKKDVFRIKEETELPSNKPNISQMLWSSMSHRNVQIKLMEDKLGISGELLVFVMYAPEEEQAPLQWMENVIPFNGTVEVSGINETMIPNISFRLSGSDPEMYKDYDGENRLIRTDAALELDIKVYEEEQIDIITDIYSPHINIIKNEKQGYFESLLVKNQSRCKVSDRFKINREEAHVLQICNASGNVKIDETSCGEDGIHVSGILEAAVVYVSSADKSPIGSETMVIPYEYDIEAKGVSSDSKYFIRPSIEQLSAVMVSTDEIEIKAVIILDALVLNSLTENVIADVTEEPLDMEIIKNMPGMAVHIVEDGEDLWSIAKKFYTTVENIKAINKLQGDTLHQGDKLLLVKQVAIISPI